MPEISVFPAGIVTNSRLPKFQIEMLGYKYYSRSSA